MSAEPEITAGGLTGSPRLAVRVLGAVLLALAPVVVLSQSPWAAGTGLFVLGIVPTLMAAPAGPRSMAAAAGGSTFTALVAVLVAQAGGWAPWLGTALVVALGLATGALRLHGLHSVGALTLSFAAYVLVDPAAVVRFLDARWPPGAGAVLIAGVVLAGSGWVLAVVVLLLRHVRLPARVAVGTLPYGVLLAVLCGLFTLLCMLWLPGTNAWWAVMTVAVILQPTPDETRTRLLGRLVGTLAGGTAAALLAMVLPAAGAVPMGVVAALAAVALLLGGAPYWQYSLAVTVSVILLTFEAEDLLLGDLQRVLTTVTAAAATAAGVWLATRLLPDEPWPSAEGLRTVGSTVSVPRSGRRRRRTVR